MDRATKRVLFRVAREYLASKGYPADRFMIELNPAGKCMADGVAFHGTCSLEDVARLASCLYAADISHTPLQRVRSLQRSRRMLTLMTLLRNHQAPVSLHYIQTSLGYLHDPNSIGQVPSHDRKEMLALLEGMFSDSAPPSGLDLSLLADTWWEFVIDQSIQTVKVHQELNSMTAKAGETAQLFTLVSA